LLQALHQRDPIGVALLSRRWVHRHGVEALERLIGELGTDDAELQYWWEAQLRGSGGPEGPGQPPIGQDDKGAEHHSRLGGEITLAPEPEPTPFAAVDGSEPQPRFEPLPAVGGLIDVDLDALARDAFVLATPETNPEPPVIPPLARFQPSVETPPAPPEPDTAAKPLSPAGEEAIAEEPIGEETTVAPHPLTRFRSLVRDCIDEVARTFQGSDGFESPSPEPLPPAAAQQPPAVEESRPKPIPKPPLAVGGTRSGAAGRPAPAPSHPDLASLRSWLPDAADHHERRAS
jgi:hypothetical protein